MNIKLLLIPLLTAVLLFPSCSPEIKEEITLESQLNGLIKNFKGEAHLYAENLTTGEVIDFGGNSIHLAASEAKLYILLTYAEQVVNGELDPLNRITLTEEDKVLGSGVLRFETTGNQFSSSFIAYMMMSISDNVATNMLLREVGGAIAVENFLKTAGIEDTKVNLETFAGKWFDTSARSLGKAAEILARPEKYGYPEEGAELCKTIMLKHYEDNGMARYLPWSPFVEEVTTLEEFKKHIPVYAGIELYGKAGYKPGYRGDVAYFKTPKSEYVIGLKCTNTDDSRPLNATNAGFEFSAEIGRLFYNYWGEN